MNLRSSALIALLALYAHTDTIAQEKTAHYDGGILSHLNVSLGFSTLGLNVEAATPITNHFKLRAGLNFFEYNSDQYQLDLDDPDQTLYKAFGVSPKYEVEGRFKTVHSHFLIDYYPFKKGIFHLTAGVYVGNTRFNAKGKLIDDTGKIVELLNGHEWPTISFGDKVLDLNQGRLDAELKFGNTVKPYLGIGLGRAISKHRLGVKMELGVLYQGDYTITQNKKLVATSDDINARIEDDQNYTDWLRFWPMVNLQVTYRIY